jgi:PAS domain S-box-containing protein
MTHRKIDVDVTHALEEVSVVAAYVVDRAGRIQWQNRGSIETIGRRVGQFWMHAVAPEDVHRARTEFARKLIGEAATTEYNLMLIGRDGQRVPVSVSSVPLRMNGKIVGVFGVAYPGAHRANLGHGADARPRAKLTARQYEVLALLADGLGTTEIAEKLGIAEQTARNHIRGALRKLGAHTRLQAVAIAYRSGLLRQSQPD